jgi:hypothetical protein
MPIWLISFLTGIITPIIQDILKKLEFDARLNSIEKKQQAIMDAFAQLNSAETSDDIKKAAAAISASWNK